MKKPEITRMTGPVLIEIKKTTMTLKRSAVTLVAIVMLALLVGIGVLGTRMRLSFMPDRTRGDFPLAMELPAGTPLEMTYDTSADLAGFLVLECLVADVVAEKTDYSGSGLSRLRRIGEGAVRSGHASAAGDQLGGGNAETPTG